MRISALLVVSSALVMASLGCSDTDGEEAGVDQGELNQIKSASFECKTTGEFYGKKAHTFKFALTGLNTKAPQWTGDSVVNEDELETPIVVTPKSSPLQYLNENYSVSMEGGKTLRLWGDGDG